MIELNKITNIQASMDIIQKAQSAIESEYIPEKLRENSAECTNECIIKLLWAMKDECSRLIMLHRKKPKNRRNEKVKL